MPQTAINKIIFDGNVLLDLTSDTVTADKLTEGYTAHDRSGAVIIGTNTKDSITTDATANASEILDGKTAYVNKAKITGIMPSNGSVTGTITTKTQQYTIPAGHHDGGGKVSIDTTEQNKLIPNNIRENVTILGVTGTMSGSEGARPQAKTVTPSSLQQVVLPDSGQGYNYLSQVTVNAIPYSESLNASGGYTVSIG